ncbi:CPCC family cysteine-rich protein [Paraflavitalea sp. CAU 1676]|uniref:CPCC family cysteine-rich protein n=1 Tax=Paraflavitalea sp. CAU 1676 TaxID=3032598 RepID=UPI0023D9FF6C|nr:CPCC family cysteine-rich protein [Paraflavitalea sp. CAU 1676]MDF2192753.1 CPCC family cysteine-rich protein [Paraflavitalea sp. CAU 1676]
MKNLLSLAVLTIQFGCGQSQQQANAKTVTTMEPAQHETYDTTKFNTNDRKTLAAFYTRRSIFDQYVSEHKSNLFTCPGCGYPTLEQRGSYEICDVCKWEDDGQDEKDAHKVMSGPNHELSLTANRLQIGQVLANKADSLKSAVNLDPAYVLQALLLHKKKQEAIAQKMNGTEKPNDPLWQAWAESTKVLHIALCRR